MNLLTKENIKSLIKKTGIPSVSIYMPTHREWNGLEQDRTRYKNNLQKAAKTLNDKGIRSLQVSELLKEPTDLLEDQEFWNYQSDGLAVFISPDEFKTFRLPFRFPEINIVSHRYYIKPLLPLLSGDGSFFLISLDQKKLRLFHGSRFSINEVKLPKGTPQSLDEAMKFDEAEKSLQYYTGTNQGVAETGLGNRSAVFHGHGSSGMDDKIHKEKVLEFFIRVNKGVFEVIKNENAPLILAGVQYLIPLYKQANSYPHIFDKAIDINPEDLKDEELHNLAWETVHLLFKKDQQKAVAMYKQFSGNGRASSNIKEIVKASYAKRVESLFVNLEDQIWGVFNPDTDEVQIENNQSNTNEDLLEFAAVHTFINHGTVYAVNKDNMPCNKPAAAVFRY